MPTEPTVFIVDDDPSIIKVIAQLVQLVGLNVRCCTSAKEFLDVFEPTGPGCLVLDVRMPGMSGLELQRELAASGRTLPVIVITGHADVRMAVEAMKLGAVEFLEKPFRAQELCDSIQTAVRLDEDNWRRREQRVEAERQIEGLTPAERRVLELVVAGKTNKMIAEELDLSVRAVEDRRARMMKKLGARSRAELADMFSAVQR
jgi:RNA polymerase sigma factor (sigma-70 family)